MWIRKSGFRAFIFAEKMKNNRKVRISYWQTSLKSFSRGSLLASSVVFDLDNENIFALGELFRSLEDCASGTLKLRVNCNNKGKNAQTLDFGQINVLNLFMRIFFRARANAEAERERREKARLRIKHSSAEQFRAC